LAGAICNERKEVDDSVNTILSLWLTCDHSPDVIRSFKEAARFLEIALGVGPDAKSDQRLRVIAKAASLKKARRRQG
jgi:hypothetical protein